MGRGWGSGLATGKAQQELRRKETQGSARTMARESLGDEGEAV